MKVHWESIQKLAEAHALEDPASSANALTRFLKFWWVQKYSRPLKDPVLESYTLDELCYEFLRHFYADPANDPVKAREEQKKKSEEDSWIQQQLRAIADAQNKATESIKKIESMAVSPEEIKPKAKKTKKKAKVEAESVQEIFPNLPEFSTKFDPE